MKTINDYLDKYPDSFCPRPFQEMVLWYDRTVKICCVEEVMPNREEVAPNFDISETYRSSPRMQKVRETFLKGKWPKECARCKREEDRGTVSLRSMTSKPRKHKFYNRIIPSIEGSENIKLPMRVEFRVGNACNMKCRMCFPLVSSLLANEFIDNLEEIREEEWAWASGEYNLGAGSLEIENKPHWLEYNKKSLNWIEDSSIDNYMNELENNLDMLEHISENGLYLEWGIIGGEPTVTPAFFNMMEKLSKYEFKKYLILKITTNALVLNDKLMTQFSNVGRVPINISIDAPGKVHEYIRGIPQGSFEKIHNNYKKYRDMTATKIESETGKTTTTIISTVSILSIFSVPDLLDFYEENDFFIRSKVSFQFVENMDLNPYHLPFEMRQEISKKILNRLDQIKMEPTIDNGMISEPHNLRAMMTDLCKKYEDYPERYKKQAEGKMHPLKAFVARTKTLDKIRKQSIHSIDTYGYFNQIINYANKI
ncbi:MAG: hypothetical protein CMQ75_03320 [Gammaproteobacteria bacterium]|nr:hypothetical protein [Gammaproteobacteria bacterium]|tara:strand:+ start:1185 stop:2630 length:1446 start_codon:yes stop_codon:yes gene_type:complete